MGMVYTIPCSSRYPGLCESFQRSDERIRKLYAMDGQPRLLDQVREHVLSRHYSILTERVYCKWVMPLGRSRSAEVQASHEVFAVYGCVFAITQHTICIGRVSLPERWQSKNVRFWPNSAATASCGSLAAHEEGPHRPRAGGCGR